MWCQRLFRCPRIPQS